MSFSECQCERPLEFLRTKRPFFVFVPSTTTDTFTMLSLRYRSLLFVFMFLASCHLAPCFSLVFSVCIASDDGLILARSCPACFHPCPRCSGGIRLPISGLLAPIFECSSPDVIVDGGESHFVGSIRPGNVGCPSRPRPSKMSSYSTSRVAVLMGHDVFHFSSLSKWIFNCVCPQPNRSRRSRRVKRNSLCISCFVSISSLAMSTSCQRSLLVCGGNSSMLRPSTASANRFARTISCGVTSMYSQTFPSIVVVLISRWYW